MNANDYHDVKNPPPINKKRNDLKNSLKELRWIPREEIPTGEQPREGDEWVANGKPREALIMCKDFNPKSNIFFNQRSKIRG